MSDRLDPPAPATKKIRAVDLTPGQYIVVSSWHDELDLPVFGSKEWYELPPERRLKKPIGDPLKVLALALPLVTVEVCQNRTRGVMDTRASEFMLVDRPYVKSLCPNYFKKLKVGGNDLPPPKHHYVLGQGWVEGPRGGRE